MIGWHHQLNEYEFKQTSGAGEGQESPACCIHGIAKSRTQLSNLNSSIVWKISILCSLHAVFIFILHWPL